MNFGSRSRNSAGETDPKGISCFVGALVSKTWLSANALWYFSSDVMSVSRLSVCKCQRSVIRDIADYSYILDFQSLLRSFPGFFGLFFCRHGWLISSNRSYASVFRIGVGV
jgi:hypothetical protein